MYNNYSLGNLTKIEPPASCPSCGGPVKQVNDQLFCVGEDCKAQVLKKLQHYAKVVKIKGLGERTLEKLEELDLKDIPDIYNLTEEQLTPLLGEKISKKLVLEIEKAKQLSLSTFLAALSIPSIGSTAGLKIEAIGKTELDSISYEELRAAGLGDIASNFFLSWVRDKWESLSSLPVVFEKPTKSTPAGNSFSVVVTGTFKESRTKIKEDIIALGGVVRESISSKTNFLLLGEASKVSSKHKKAIELGIPILHSMEDLLNILEKT